MDLEFTSDNRLVATHGWQGCEYWLKSRNAPSYDEFMVHKIYERFTPLDKEMIDSIMLSNPNLSLVTDKISTPTTIDSLFRGYKERVWVECFSDEDYYDLNKLGYHVLRSEYPPTKIATLTHLIKRFSIRDLKIRNYTFAGVSTDDIPRRHGNGFAIFTAPNKTIADSIFARDKRIKFVYVDDIEDILN